MASLHKTSRLVYVGNDEPGFRRERRGAKFEYFTARGAPIRDDRILARIRRLAIPPAYTDVWICRRANGHLQATGRDARGRKQYRYHLKWRQLRDRAKYDRMLAFSEHLPGLRRRVAADLRLPGVPRAKVLATVVRLLETSLIRVGNDEYARTNGSFGLTTLKNDHVRVRGAHLQFRFRGKSRKVHDVRVNDARLARIVRHCQDLPGQALFQFINDAGEVENIDSSDVNAYIRGRDGTEFSAKDFRTWAGTLLTARVLAGLGNAPDEAVAKARIASAIEQVAARLGNTPAICRKSYVHPAILDAYLANTLKLPASAHALGKTRLSAQERAIQKLLKRQEAENRLAPARRRGAASA
ncbi:MAG TPA: DNA topoisomerase IB [Rudaea sp.]|nr:DNA topoisomerase IB [Rudaea sp.]HSC12153.1 DNA topoisomerase IB [Rhodanobacteraceae bacterium]